MRAWRDFCETTKVGGLKDIDDKAAVRFRDAVVARKWKGKTEQNCFARVRALLSYCKKRAIAVQEINTALVNLALMVPSSTTVSLDSTPVEPEDFRSMLDHAEGENRALVLLMLNGALYPQEAVDLKWSDIKPNGCLVAHRSKTGRCVRVAVLWKETLEALAQVPKRGEHIFYGNHGGPLGVKGAEKRLRVLRKAAGVPHVKGSWFRDGACQAAAEANVTEQLQRVYEGHASGIQDRYIKRNPKMVAPACSAVYNAYMAAPALKIAETSAA